MKILVVDDNSSLRMLMRMDFQELLGNDYIVLIAKDGEEAMQIILNEENIKLVITDFHMPKKNGIELAEFIRQCCSKIKIIIISSGTDQHIQDAARVVADLFSDKSDFLNTSDEKKKEIIFNFLK